MNTAAARITPRLPELHNAAWWAEKLMTSISNADHNDAEAFNHVLWEGIMGDAPYPTNRSGLDLRKHRARLLKNWARSKRAHSRQQATALTD